MRCGGGEPAMALPLPCKRLCAHSAHTPLSSRVHAVAASASLIRRRFTPMVAHFGGRCMPTRCVAKWHLVSAHPCITRLYPLQRSLCSSAFGRRAKRRRCLRSRWLTIEHARVVTIGLTWGGAGHTDAASTALRPRPRGVTRGPSPTFSDLLRPSTALRPRPRGVTNGPSPQTRQLSTASRPPAHARDPHT